VDRLEEVQTKLETLRGWLARTRASGVLLSSQSNFAWATAGGHSHVALGQEAGAAAILVTAADAYILTPNIERRRLFDEELMGLCFETVEYPWHEPESVAGLVGDLCDGPSAVSDLGIGSAPPEPSLVELRRVLLEPELERYRMLGRAAGRALETACRGATPGDTELDVAARVAFECSKEGILPLVNLVAADDRIARYRHPLPTRNRLSRTLLAAVTGRRHGLHASATRMVAFVDPDEDLLARHRSVARVDAHMILNSRPGRSLGAIMRAAMEDYSEEGFEGEWKLHHQGGLTGYAGREVFATPSSTYELKMDQALTWNPSITRVKSEDTVLVTGSSHEVITSTGEWPEEAVNLAGGSVRRPALLTP
jgi:Xaa-Pro aminopeptidase